MNLLNAESISKSYGTKMLFNNIHLSIDDGDRIGLIGVNGTGKSTLLRILAGLEPPEEGRISVRNGIAIEYLPQNPQLDDHATVIEQVFRGSTPVIQAIRDYESALLELESGVPYERLERRLTECNARMDTLEAWNLENDAKKILTRLGLSNFSARMGELSGGQRKRVAMAAALIQPADLLILDEPTNHIDTDTVQWLEQYLHKIKPALLMVTHDRYFLDRVANRIIELDQAKLYGYSGNYSLFLEQKAERLMQQAASEEKRQNLLRRELSWIRRGARARTTKQKARIDRFEQLQQAGSPTQAEQLEISLGSERLGKKVMELASISKRYLGRPILCDFSYIVQRDDRIGIIGPNGAGKTTLLKLLAGVLLPDSGSIDVGPTVKIGYFSQEQEEMNGSLRVIEYIKEAAEQIQTSDGGTVGASQMLERFLFPPALQWTPISKLSGGERRRLYLLRILIGRPNVLLLDEPTNDLDIQTLGILEEYLEDFPGAVIVVSHDRYFLDRTVDTIWSLEGDSRVTHHVGNYSDYQAWISERSKEAESEEAGNTSKPVNGAVSLSDPSRKEKPLKLSFKEQKELEEIDEQIAALEQQLDELNQAMLDSVTDYERLQQLGESQRQLQEALNERVERWAYLNELAERIEKQKNR